MNDALLIEYIAQVKAAIFFPDIPGQGEVMETINRNLCREAIKAAIHDYKKTVEMPIKQTPYHGPGRQR